MKKWIIHKAKSRRYTKRVWKQRHNTIRKNYGSTIDLLLKRDEETLRKDLEMRYGIPRALTSIIDKRGLINLMREKDLKFIRQTKIDKIKNLLQQREEEGEYDKRLLLKPHRREEFIRQLERLRARNLSSNPLSGTDKELLGARKLAMKMKTPEAALRVVRRTYGKPEELECVEASCALLDPIRRFYPDAELVKLSVKRPGTDATDSHTVIISDKANKIIDSQAGQFKGRLGLHNQFIDKGIYNIKEYSENIPYAYAERVDDDKRIDLFKTLKNPK